MLAPGRGETGFGQFRYSSLFPSSTRPLSRPCLVVCEQKRDLEIAPVSDG